MSLPRPSALNASDHSREMEENHIIEYIQRNNYPPSRRMIAILMAAEKLFNYLKNEAYPANDRQAFLNSFIESPMTLAIVKNTRSFAEKARTNTVNGTLDWVCSGCSRVISEVENMNQQSMDNHGSMLKP